MPPNSPGPHNIKLKLCQLQLILDEDKNFKCSLEVRKRSPSKETQDPEFFELHYMEFKEITKGTSTGNKPKQLHNNMVKWMLNYHLTLVINFQF